jgi:TonB-linked SusC/RagA family outer membrane protein
MSATGGMAMRKMLRGFLMSVVLSGTALAQQTVTGTVTAVGGTPLPGVTVRVQGTDTRAVTNTFGRYTVTAPADATLSFSLLGRRAVEVARQGRATIDVAMEPVAFLEEVTVTGYTEQRRADITGAVSSMNVEAASRQTSASVLQRLSATVPGVTVENSGSPGSRSTVRVRGISSFQNNDPLYVVDGTPVQDSYINFLNPNDITSVQVLKDASASSIYGSRASNGVIVIETTKKGVRGPPRSTLSIRTGVTTPTKGYDDFLILNSLEYYEVIRQSYVNAGLAVPTNIYGSPANPTVPNYIWPNNCGPGGTTGACNTVNEASYSFPNNLIMPGSPGTNWWKAVFSPAMVGDYNLEVSGGGDDNSYGVSFNYYNQEGTAAYNAFKRGSVRVNTAFSNGRFTFGENISLSAQRHHGGIPDDQVGEGGILGKNILMQPIVPLYDVGGNFASGKAVTLGNNTNPLKFAFFARDNETRNDRIFGNIFGSVDIRAQTTFRSQLGFNLGQAGFTGFNPITPENAEPTTVNSINENSTTSTDWTWSNTLRYAAKVSAQHNLNLLLGQEANANTFRFINAGMSNLISTVVNARYLNDALGDPGTKNVNSTGGRSALLSFFGKADYNYAEKYVASFTLRQDGSSRFSPDNRWGTFPAFGLGWRMSKEPFMANNRFLSDAMLRFGWGVTGNQAIPAGRIVAQFGGNRGDTFYDIAGSNDQVVAGFRETSLGNQNLKWEENTSTNVGADLAFLSGKVNVVLDLYRRETDNLLFDPPIPATAGIAAPPLRNVGKMRNNGLDFSVGYNSAAWSASFNGSHYRNKIVSIDGVQDFFFGPISTRFGNQVINKVGHPIGSFYGLLTDGYFRDAADSAAHQSGTGAAFTCGVATVPCHTAPAPGRIKFKDFDGDGQITLADRTIIGSPHPDFTAGFDFAWRRGAFDVSATLFGTFGNEIFDVQKEFYVFRNFSTNVRSDLLTDSWTPTNQDAKYPRLDVNDNQSNALSDFYIEDGSYVRLRSLQLGYNVPPRFARWLSATRVYVQAENLFTLTGYPGLDPALPAANVFGPAGDIRDQYRGVDRGSYPTNRMFSLGLVTSF